MRQVMRLIILGVFLNAIGELPAATYYVDNVNGREGNDGLSEAALNALSGPVRSINRALELVQSGDTIILTNTGVPYYESFSLVGRRLGGVSNVPLTILGNGSTLSGLRRLPADGWQTEGGGLWRVSFTRKGFYRLLRDGFRLPEHQTADGVDPRPTLPPGQWCAYRGSVYYRQEGLNEPGRERFDYAADEMGITLYQVEHVRIVDLNVEHFRVDGINAHNMCRGVVLENVVCRQNGRSGLAVGGTSSVIFRGGRLEQNGRDAALITGKGTLDVQEAELDTEPTVLP